MFRNQLKLSFQPWLNVDSFLLRIRIRWISRRKQKLIYYDCKQRRIVWSLFLATIFLSLCPAECSSDREALLYYLFFFFLQRGQTCTTSCGVREEDLCRLRDLYGNNILNFRIICSLLQIYVERDHTVKRKNFSNQAISERNVRTKV